MGDIGVGVAGGKRSRLPLLPSLVLVPFIFDVSSTKEDGDIPSSGKRVPVSMTKLLRIFAAPSPSTTPSGGRPCKISISEHEPVRRRRVCLEVVSKSGGDASDRFGEDTGLEDEEVPLEDDRFLLRRVDRDSGGETMVSGFTFSLVGPRVRPSEA